MTPKDKAKELVDKFTVVGLQQRNEGIQCALIAVDEILSNPLFFSDWGQLYFWQSVKKEIELIKKENPSLLICTCSTYGEECDNDSSIYRIDKPIVEYIVQNFKKIGLVYTANSTKKVSENLTTDGGLLPQVPKKVVSQRTKPALDAPKKKKSAPKKSAKKTPAKRR